MASTQAERPDFDILQDMSLDAEQLAQLIGRSGECVFNWTTRDGYPMGVVVRYLYRDGAFWTTSVEHRTRLKALAKRPQTAIVLNRDGHSATLKGESTLHRPGDPDFELIKGWFFPTLAGTDHHPDDPTAQAIEDSLDTPHQVIVQTRARTVVNCDFTRLAPTPPDNQTRLAAAYAAFTTGDLEPILDLLDDNVTWCATGPSPIGGVRTGKQAVGEFFAAMMQLYGGTLRLDVRAVFADAQHGLVLTAEHGTHAGEPLDYTSTHIYTFYHGKVRSFLALQDDAYHQFWANHR
jgi:ketosteroid isomerase-like protein